MGTKLALLVLGTLFACAHGATVLLLDSPQNLYLNHRQDIVVDGPVLGAVFTALTALRPAERITEASALQVADIVKSTPFSVPHALVSINIAGIDADTYFTDQQLSQTRQMQRITVSTAPGISPAETVLQTLSAIAAHNPEVNFQVLDHVSIQECLDDCVEQLLLDLASTLDAKYTPGVKPLTGQLTFKSGARLDLNSNADRLWAVELVTLREAASRALDAASYDAPQDIVVLDATLVGPQALARAHAADAELSSSARDAVLVVLHEIFSKADEVFQGKAVFQVGLLGSVNPAQGGKGLAPLVQLKEAARRRLMSDDRIMVEEYGEDAAVAAQRFSTKAAGYGSFLLVMYFTFAGIYCMCNMNFKQDTLLYSRAKVD